MEATDLLVRISSHYPSFAYLIKLIAMLIGTWGVGYAAWLVIQVELLGTKTSQEVGFGKVFLIFTISGCIIGFAVTMNIIGNTFFNYGDFILGAFNDSDNWLVPKGTEHVKSMQLFVIITSKLLGLIYGFWGLVGALASAMPRSESRYGMAITRIVVGAAMFNPIAVLDFFGGWGTKFLIS